LADGINLAVNASNFGWIGFAGFIKGNLKLIALS